MVIERIVRIVAGSFVLASVALSHLHHPAWLLATLFVGANLLQSGLTRWCLLEDILVALGFEHGDAGPSRSVPVEVRR